MSETKEALYYNIKFIRSINILIPKGNTQILTTTGIDAQFVLRRNFIIENING